MRNRQFEIMIHLLDMEHTTCGELASLFEVSEKTIYRDLDRLSMLGVPVYTKRGQDGGVFMKAPYTFSKSFFTKENLCNIVLALSIVDQLSKDGVRGEVLQKLKLIDSQFITHLESNHEERLIVDILEERITMRDSIHHIISRGMDEQRLLHVKMNASEREVVLAPISYVLRKDGLWLYNFTDQYEIIRINNLEMATLLEETFEKNFIPYQKNKENLWNQT